MVGALRLLIAGILFIIALFFSVLFALISIPLINDLFVSLPPPQPMYVWATITPSTPPTVILAPLASQPLPVAPTIIPAAQPLPTVTPIPTATMTNVPPPTLLPTGTATDTPSPMPTLTPDRSMCDPSYPTLCIPPGVGEIYDCGSPIVGGQKNFTVYPPDPQRFDGNNNGVGCEEN